MSHTIQILVGVSILVSTVVIAAIFWWVGSRTQPQQDYKSVTERGYRLRREYFWGLLIVSILLFGVGIYSFPYPQIVESRVTGKPFVVKVMSSQFMFDMSETEVPRGWVRFDVMANDVNHGFGIYKDGWLIAQTQAMPDYVNRLYVNFTEPGKYEVWCLEYCGLAHHIMMTEFEVK